MTVPSISPVKGNGDYTVRCTLSTGFTGTVYDDTSHDIWHDSKRPVGLPSNLQNFQHKFPPKNIPREEITFKLVWEPAF